MRRILAVLSAAVLLVVAAPAAAQIGIGGHLVNANDAFGGTLGAGARVRLGVPLFPISVALNGEYFFPSCDDCSLSGATLDVNYALPIPLVQPWVGVGWSVRRVEVAGEKATESGANIGAGAELRLTSLRPFLDVRYEFANAPEKQFVMRVGFMIR